MEKCACGNDYPPLVLLVDGVRLCEDCYIHVLGLDKGPEPLDMEEARAMEAQRWKFEDEEDWP